jgi:HPt (histidine-containing phosphotransfer) domain-containing protein
MADDPEMSDLLRDFVGNLTEFRRKVESALKGGDLHALRVAGHQLKGSGAGYGFPILSDAAADLEDAVEAAGTVNDAVRTAADRLLRLVARAQAGATDPTSP